MTVRLAVPTLACLAALLIGAAPAHAAKQCAEPGADWQRATPAEAGMDAAALQDAMDFASVNASYAARVYRRGCLVAEDRNAARNRDAQYESWSMAKSITAMTFGRAMTEHLLSPDDVVGSLVPEADAAHGKIRMEDLLTMSSGLRWNGFRDYNIFTMPDRIIDALTLEPVYEPGTYYEYAQSPVSLLAEIVGRSAGQETQWFAQRQLMDPLGIEEHTWDWVRDKAGHVGGFHGVNMKPDDFGRLGELMRRGGVWRGKRLLSKEFMERALTPSKVNGCYGWLIWLNNGKPCIGPRIQERSVKPTVDFPTMPRDMYRFVGLFGQLVTVFPSQEIVVVRVGQDPNVQLHGGGSWEQGIYERVLGAVRDTPVKRPTGDEPAPVRDEPNPDQGFQNALAEPDQYSKGIQQDPLPPAGPRRARAPRFELALPRISKKGLIVLRVFCPPRPAAPCEGRAHLPRTRSSVPFSVPAGDSRLVRFTLTSRNLRASRGKRLTLPAKVTNADALGGITVTRDVTVQGPKPLKKKRAARRRR